MRLLHIIICGSIIIGAPAIVAAIGLHVGARVEHVEQLKRQIRDDNARSHLLAIELANLERPDHVQQLADQLQLGLQMPTSQQYLMAASDLPLHSTPANPSSSVLLAAQKPESAPARLFAAAYSNQRTDSAAITFAVVPDSEHTKPRLLP